MSLAPLGLGLRALFGEEALLEAPALALELEGDGVVSRTVHRRHRRQRAAIHAQEPLVDRREARVAVAVLAPSAHGGQAADVGTGAERRWRAGHYERAHAVVALQVVDRGDDLVDE